MFKIYSVNMILFPSEFIRITCNTEGEYEQTKQVVSPHFGKISSEDDEELSYHLTPREVFESAFAVAVELQERFSELYGRDNVRFQDERLNPMYYPNNQNNNQFTSLLKVIKFEDEAE